MKKRLSFFWVCLLLLGLILSGFGTNEVQAAESLGVTPGSATIGNGESSPFGMNIQAAARYGIPGQLQVPLDSAKRIGVAWNREEIRWSLVARGNSFDFSLVNEAVDKSLARGINVLGLLVYNRDNSKTMPDLNAWSNYVSETVRFFRGKVNYWQVWNEPENDLYFAGANPAEYARLLRTSYQVIKAANPNAKVVTAGVNGFAVPWMEQMVAAGGENQYDILAVHPYVLFNTSPEAKYWTDNQLTYFLAFNKRHGNKPMWATEFGWTTNSSDSSMQVSETAQANYLARSYVSGLASGLDKMFVYQFHDENKNNDNYGLVRNDWTSPKPSLPVYQNLVNRLSGATFKDKIDLFDTSRQNIENFSSGTAWNPFNQGAVSSSASVSSEQSHSGGKALKLDYSLNGGPYIEMGPGSPVQLNSDATKIGFWVYGDNNAALIKILVRGADNQLFVYEPGKVKGAFWHRLEAFLPGEAVFASGDGQLRRPVRFQSIQVTRQPDISPSLQERNFGGTLYFDDFYAQAGANVQLYRFEKGGRTMDVVWSDGGGASVSIPTQSSQGDVKGYDRNGGGAGFNVSNGNLNINAGDDMLFFEHNAGGLLGSGGGGTTGGGGSSGGGGTARGVPCGVDASSVNAANKNFTNQNFQNFWGRYDFFAPGNRSYVWGDKPIAAGNEPYAQAPNNSRSVLYFDKSRMEITNPNGDPNANGYITNGLLTVELITGKVQIGDDQGDPKQFILCVPSQVPVAGDNDDVSGPKYAALAGRLGDTPKRVGELVQESIDANGNKGSFGDAGRYNVTGSYFEPTTNHTIASPFWNFLNDANQKILVNNQAQIGKLFDPYYIAPGLPITEAYWAKVKVGGQVKDVLIQAFERRVLTFTPSNQPPFQVEWGNIGRHYYNWRYGVNP